MYTYVDPYVLFVNTTKPGMHLYKTGQKLHTLKHTVRTHVVNIVGKAGKKEFQTSLLP